MISRSLICCVVFFSAVATTGGTPADCRLIKGQTDVFKINKGPRADSGSIDALDKFDIHCKTRGWRVDGAKADRGSPAQVLAQATTAAPSDNVVRFSEPIKVGPYPVNGNSLEELINAVPLFAPIEGLPEKVWQKTCNNCHKWNRQTLCEQATLYVKNPASALRIQHPYGGPAKIAMTNWAKNGCQ